MYEKHYNTQLTVQKITCAFNDQAKASEMQSMKSCGRICICIMCMERNGEHGTVRECNKTEAVI